MSQSPSCLAVFKVQETVLLPGQRLGPAPTPHETPQEEDHHTKAQTNSNKTATTTATTTATLHQQQQCLQVTTQQYWVLTEGTEGCWGGEKQLTHHRTTQEQLKHQCIEERACQVRQDLRREAKKPTLLCCIMILGVPESFLHMTSILPHVLPYAILYFVTFSSTHTLHCTSLYNS